MKTKNLSPIASFFRALHLLISGRMRFPRDRVGETLVLENGECWTIFRQVVVTPEPGRPAKAGAVFRPRFRVAGMSLRQNIRFSLLPIPFFTGLPGFRSKLWLYQAETGDFQGYYEWDSVEDAENYANSFAMQFMTRRSVPGSVSCRVIPVTDRENSR